MPEFEIYFEDLTKEAQERLLEYAELSDEKEANWDIFPVSTVYFEDDEY